MLRHNTQNQVEGVMINSVELCLYHMLSEFHVRSWNQYIAPPPRETGEWTEV